MSMPPCRRCGTVHPRRMHAYMSAWFAPLAELAVEPSYFYLCPSCHTRLIEPHLDDVLRRLPMLRPDPTADGDSSAA